MSMSSTAQPVIASDPLVVVPLAGVSTTPDGAVVPPWVRRTVRTNCGASIVPGVTSRTVSIVSRTPGVV
jgi:hypothetical protein